MKLLLEILNKILINEGISIDSVTDAIKNKYEVVINYVGDPKHGIAPGIRVIQAYVYGLTKAGNPVIRAYQPYGDTASKVPSWKFFRIDRIKSWKKTYSIFNKPAPLFNPDGDKSMSVVFDIANFSNDKEKQNITTGPKKINVLGKMYNIDKILKDRELEKKKYKPITTPIPPKPKNKDIPEPEIKGETNKETNIQQPDIINTQNKEGEIEQKTNDNTYKTSGDEQLQKVKDFNKRLDNVRKIDLTNIPRR